MKKILLCSLLLIATLVGNAQIIRSNSSEERKMSSPTVEVEKPWNHSGLFVDTGIGLLTGDVENDFAWEFGWGYRWHITNGVSWEIARVGFNVGVSNFSDTFDFRITSGLRYDTPRFPALGNRSLFAAFQLGYGKLLGEDDGNGGFVYGIDAGIKLNRKCSLSLFWQGDSEKFNFYYGRDEYSSTAKWGMFGLKIEWQFR